MLGGGGVDGGTLFVVMQVLDQLLLLRASSSALRNIWAGRMRSQNTCRRKPVMHVVLQLFTEQQVRAYCKRAGAIQRSLVRDAPQEMQE